MKLIHNFILIILTTLIVVLLTEITLRVIDPLDKQDKAKIYMKINYPNDYNYKNLEKNPKYFHILFKLFNTLFLKTLQNYSHDQMDLEKMRIQKTTTLIIIVLGGSITYGSGVDKPEDTWANILQKN